MAKQKPQPKEKQLKFHPHCPEAVAENSGNKITTTTARVRTLKEVVQLRFLKKVRRCPGQSAKRFAQPYRPEQESRRALPTGIWLRCHVLVGSLRQATS